MRTSTTTRAPCASGPPAARSASWWCGRSTPPAPPCGWWSSTRPSASSATPPASSCSPAGSSRRSAASTRSSPAPCPSPTSIPATGSTSRPTLAGGHNFGEAAILPALDQGTKNTYMTIRAVDSAAGHGLLDGHPGGAAGARDPRAGAARHPARRALRHPPRLLRQGHLHLRHPGRPALLADLLPRATSAGSSTSSTTRTPCARSTPSWPRSQPEDAIFESNRWNDLVSLSDRRRRPIPAIRPGRLPLPAADQPGLPGAGPAAPSAGPSLQPGEHRAAGQRRDRARHRPQLGGDRQGGDRRRLRAAHRNAAGLPPAARRPPCRPRAGRPRCATPTATASRPPTRATTPGRWRCVSRRATSTRCWCAATPATATPQNRRFVRFTDYTLDGAARNTYFYASRELSNQLTMSALRPIVGPVKLVNAAPAEAPGIGRVMVTIAKQPDRRHATGCASSSTATCRAKPSARCSSTAPPARTTRSACAPCRW